MTKSFLSRLNEFADRLDTETDDQIRARVASLNLGYLGKVTRDPFNTFEEFSFSGKIGEDWEAIGQRTQHVHQMGTLVLIQFPRLEEQDFVKIASPPKELAHEISFPTATPEVAVLVYDVC